MNPSPRTHWSLPRHAAFQLEAAFEYYVHRRSAAKAGASGAESSVMRRRKDFFAASRAPAHLALTAAYVLPQVVGHDCSRRSSDNPTLRHPSGNTPLQMHCPLIGIYYADYCRTPRRSSCASIGNYLVFGALDWLTAFVCHPLQSSKPPMYG
ncbi:hypothetical protein PYCCODRAFT_379867 [Trametes coccinea BRFM310]|uniref:Uncharacterized protein n=1 Tax=Trametes coccinea (strain BRFM310) TaxID=1353009 RepID=A0A1Y2J6F7_TRAC3|nr:hypothetical protein PYCCODRAFT_379867 [Trametes coccinea BRFM310]